MDFFSILPKFEIKYNKHFNTKPYQFKFDSFLELEQKIVKKHIDLVNKDNTISHEFMTNITTKYDITYFLEYFNYNYMLGIDVKLKDLVSFFIGQRLKNQITNDYLYKENRNNQRLKSNTNNNIILRCRYNSSDNVLHNDTFRLIIEKLIDVLQYDIQTVTVDFFYYFYPGMIDVMLYVSSFFSSTLLRCIMALNFTALGHFIVFHNPTKDLTVLISTLKYLLEKKINLTTGFLDISDAERLRLVKFLTTHYQKYVKIKEPYYLKYKDDVSKTNFINLSVKYARSQNMNILKYNMEPDHMMKNFMHNFEHLNLIQTGDKISINSAITMTEGKVVAQLIHNHTLSKILELGMGYGIISIYIILTFIKKTKKGKINRYIFKDNTPDESIDLNDLTNNSYQPKLTSIDPYQETHWQNIGKKLITKHSLQQYHSLKSEPSDIKLPEYLKKKKKFDLIFIHYNSIKENILVDVYYAIKLLNTNGFLVINNAGNHSRLLIMNYIEFNFKHLVKQDYKEKTLTIFKAS